MASTRIYRTAGSPTLNTKHTISLWFKRSRLSFGDTFIMDGYQDSSNRFKLAFDSSDRLELYNTHGGSYKYNVRTNRKFRDVSAFYHLVIRIDMTQSSASDRVRIYVNGTEEESFETYTDSTQDDANNVVNESGATISIGDYQGGNNGFSGLMAHFHFIDGTSYAPTTFGETDSTSGIWKPKTAPSVTYGNNGFFLKFENSGNMDLDSSGNNLTFTTSGTLTQNTDTPTNNFCTLNALDYNSISLSNGNLEGAWSQSAGTFGFTRGTIGFGSGKYYWEVKISSSDNSAGLGLGVVDITGKEQISSTSNQGNSIASFFGVGASFTTAKALNKQSNNSSTSISGSWANDDIIGIAYDGSTGKIYMWKNGSEFSGQTFASGTSFNDVNLTADTFVAPYFGVGDGGSGTKNVNVKFNFGQGYFGTTAVSTNSGNGYQDANSYGKFNYSVPSGHYAINTKNLKEFG